MTRVSVAMLSRPGSPGRPRRVRPSARLVVSHAPRGTTSPSIAIATPRRPGSTPSASSTSAMRAPTAAAPRLAVDRDHATHLPRREAIAARSAGSGRRAGERVGDEVAGDRARAGRRCGGAPSRRRGPCARCGRGAACCRACRAAGRRTSPPARAPGRPAPARTRRAAARRRRRAVTVVSKPLLLHRRAEDVAAVAARDEVAALPAHDALAAGRGPRDRAGAGSGP